MQCVIGRPVLRRAMNAHPTGRGSWIGWRGVEVKPQGLPSAGPIARRRKPQGKGREARAVACNPGARAWAGASGFVDGQIRGGSANHGNQGQI